MRIAGGPRLADSRYMHATYQAPDGTCFDIRDLEDGDEALIADLFARSDRDDVRLRFFCSVRVFDHKFLWPLVHYDHAQAVAVLAIERTTGRAAGVSRLHCDIFRTFGEFAIFVRSDLKGEGLGHCLMEAMIGWARDHGIPLVTGEVLRENGPMLGLCRRLGFTVKAAPGDPGVAHVELGLDGETGSTGASLPLAGRGKGKGSSRCSSADREAPRNPHP